MNYHKWMERYKRMNSPCERCGKKYEYVITPCYSRVCEKCANYLLGYD